MHMAGTLSNIEHFLQVAYWNKGNLDKACRVITAWNEKECKELADYPKYVWVGSQLTVVSAWVVIDTLAVAHCMGLFTSCPTGLSKVFVFSGKQGEMQGSCRRSSGKSAVLSLGPNLPAPCAHQCTLGPLLNEGHNVPRGHRFWEWEC